MLGGSWNQSNYSFHLVICVGSEGLVHRIHLLYWRLFWRLFFILKLIFFFIWKWRSIEHMNDIKCNLTRFLIQLGLKTTRSQFRLWIGSKFCGFFSKLRIILVNLDYFFSLRVFTTLIYLFLPEIFLPLIFLNLFLSTLFGQKKEKKSQKTKDWIFYPRRTDHRSIWP